MVVSPPRIHALALLINAVCVPENHVSYIKLLSVAIHYRELNRRKKKQKYFFSLQLLLVEQRKFKRMPSSERNVLYLFCECIFVVRIALSSTTATEIWPIIITDWVSVSVNANLWNTTHTFLRRQSCPISLGARTTKNRCYLNCDKEWIQKLIKKLIMFGWCGARLVP